MSDGIDAMIASLRALGDKSFAEDVAKEASPKLLEAIQGTASKGQTPEGVAWKAKKDGTPALVNASKHITAKVLGTVIQLDVPYPYSIHHHQEGTATRPRRQILPDGELPPALYKAIEEAAARVFARRTR